MRIPQHIIDDVRNRTDLLQIIGQFVDLKRKGANWWGLSPFKSENTPSFAVHPGKGIWKCFASGNAGNVFTFLQETQGMTFRESVKYCADQLGITIEEETPEQQERHKLMESLWAANAWAADQFHQQRADTDYWQARGITAETQAAFLLGYADPSWESLLGAGGKSIQTSHLKTLGLVTETKAGKLVDMFRDRAMFPIHDHMGHVVAFGGRIITSDPKQPKYINSPESPIYHKSSVLYGLYQAKDAIRQADHAVLVEGYTDTTAMHQAGIRQTVASCGTAITPDQIRLLQRFTQNLILILDDDAAGQKAAAKAIQVALAEGMTVKLVKLMGGHDPDSYLKEHGPEKMQQLLQDASDWLPWMITHLGWDEAKTPAEWGVIIRQIVDIIHQIPFELAQELYLQAAAEQLGFSVDVLLKANRDTGSEPETTQAPSGFTERNYAYFEHIRMATGQAACDDFTAGSHGEIIATYHTIKGQPFTTSTKGEKTTHTRNITRNESRYGVFIPPAVRSMLAGDITPDQLPPLVMVPGEINAWLLSHAGLMAVGLPHPEAFLSKRNSQHLHPLMKQLLAVGFQKIFYLAPDDLWALPDAPGKASDNPYQNGPDTKLIADDYATTLQRLKERFLECSVHLLYPYPVPDEFCPDVLIDRHQRGWLEELLTEAMAHTPAHWMEGLHRSIRDAFTGNDVTVFGNMPVSDRTAHHFQKLLRIHDPQAFYDFHGVESLGVLFQWGKFVYEVDRDGQVKLKQESVDRQQVIERDGIYWANGKDGMKPISDFILQGVLKIKGTEPLVLAQIQDVYGKTYDMVLDGKLLLNADQFHLRVYGLADCFFHGTNAQLRHLQQMTLKNMQQAYMMDKLGHQEVKTGSGKIQVYAFGNGILTYESGFIPSDEKGLLNYAGETFYLPAESEYKISDDQDELYQTHIGMSLVQGSASWDEWVNLLFEVYQPLKAHFGLAYTIMSLYRDVVYKVTSKIPVAYFQGVTGSGKSELRMSLGKLFGELPCILINGNPSVAAVGSHFKAVRNAWVAFEEFNVFKMANQRQDWIVDMVKSAYDGKSRAVRQNAHTDLLKNSPIHAAVLCLGQESFYQTDEAVPNRFVIREWQKRDFDAAAKRRFSDLKMMEAAGIGHLTEMLLMKRAAIENNFAEKMLAVEQHLKKQIANSGEDVLDRLIQNWAMLLTPLLILIREGHINYPLTPKQILDDAVESILDHARKSMQLGIAGEFWSFIESEYGGTLDHTAVFYYEPENEVRIRFKPCYSKFSEWLKRRDDKSTVNPGAKNIQDKLREMPAFEKESTTYMGYVLDHNGRVKMTYKDGQESQPIYAKKHCMCFKLDKLGIQLREIDYGTPDTPQEPEPITQTPAGQQTDLWAAAGQYKSKAYEQ